MITSFMNLVLSCPTLENLWEGRSHLCKSNIVPKAVKCYFRKPLSKSVISANWTKMLVSKVTLILMKLTNIHPVLQSKKNKINTLFTFCSCEETKDIWGGRGNRYLCTCVICYDLFDQAKILKKCQFSSMIRDKSRGFKKLQWSNHKENEREQDGIDKVKK